MRSLLKLNSKKIWNPETRVEESLYYNNGEPIVYSPAKEFTRENHLSAVELFSGAGGLSTGLSDAGFRVVAGVDIHKPSTKTFSHNHRNAYAINADIKSLDPYILSDLTGVSQPDLLAAGVPCQGFSLNNRKRYARDDRNFLFREFVRFIKHLKPKAIVLENVSGMKSTSNGHFIDLIKKEIGNSGDYEVSHTILNAASYGVPQLRNRLFFVGVPKGLKFQWPEPRLFGTKDSPFITVREALSDLPTLPKPGDHSTGYENDASSEYQKLMRKNSAKLLNHSSPKHPSSTVKKILNTKPGEPIYAKFTQRIRLSWDLPSPTQVAGGIRSQYQFGHPEQGRGLTIRERARIQSFPDNYEFFGGVVQSRIQTGNAVPPILASAIGQQLLKSLEA